MIADPTAPENIGSVHGRGIYLMKALMDEVRFEEGGVVLVCERAPDQLQPKMHRKTRWSRSVSGYPPVYYLPRHDADMSLLIRNRYREHL